MTFGRSKCVIKGSPYAAQKAAPKKVMPHEEFINRIRKSLYFGCDTRAEHMEVSRPLAEYASELFSEPHKGHSLNRLNFVTAGSVHASPCSLIMALIYLDRLNITDPGYARRITPQELFIVSMMVSTKFYTGYDEEVYLSDWAQDGHMTEERLKQLELEFLCAIDWNIYISNELFFNKLTSIEKTLARREGLRRGWLTYTELVQMLPTFTLVKFLFNNITVMAVSYAASVMTIAGAFFLASQIPGHVLHNNKSATDSSSADVASEAEVVLQAPSSLRLSVKNGTRNAVSVVTTVSKPNATYIALNVEVELLNLERQYREETLREELRRRQNEIGSDSRLTLPEAVQEPLQSQNNHKNRKKSASDMQRNWFAFKEEYSDGKGEEEFTQYAMKLPVFVSASVSPLQPHFTDCFINFGNCTSSLFWQLYSDATQQPYTLLPWVWFKFM